jgi:stress-induced morphogen
MTYPNIEQVIIERIQKDLSPVEVTLNDMTGTRDHWEAVIISPQFEGVRLIARQQKVYQALGELMAGPIHAFTMQTLTPSEAEKKGLMKAVKESSQEPTNSATLVTLK